MVRSMSTSPFAGDSETYTALSAGLGFRADRFFIDFAYRRQDSREGYNPYVVQQDGRDPLSVIETDLGKEGRQLTEAERSGVCRWIDSLDRI